MANIKSSEKRNRQNQKRAARNRVYRSAARTAVKKARLAIEQGDDNALELVRKAEQALDRAATKGVVHKNNAARRQSRLMRYYNKSQDDAAQPAVKPAASAAKPAAKSAAKPAAKSASKSAAKPTGKTAK